MIHFTYKNFTKEGVRVFIGDRANPYTSIGPGMERDLVIPWPHFNLETFPMRVVITEKQPPKKEK